MKRRYSRSQNFAKAQTGERRHEVKDRSVKHKEEQVEEEGLHTAETSLALADTDSQGKSDVVYKVTFRNFQSSQALIDYIEKRFTPILRRFFDRELIVNVTLKKTNLCVGEISAHFPHFTLVASTEDKDFYKLVDKLKDIVREQLRRHKERLLGH